MEIKQISEQAVFVKGKKENVLLNPNKELSIKSWPRLVVYTETKGVMLNDVKEDRLVIAGPGEYEVGGVEVYGFSGGDGCTYYTMTVDGVVLGIVGKIKEMLSDKKIEKIAGVDVLIVDMAVEKIVGAKKILDLAKKWGANYILPLGDPKGEEMKRFLDEADAEGEEMEESLKVDKDNLPDGTEVVLLKQTNL